MQIPLSTREHFFEDFRYGTNIAVAPLNTFRGRSRPACAMFCSKNALCLSFTFCNPAICTLSSQDLYSPAFEVKIDKSCEYFGMKREAYPVCAEKGEDRAITEDGDPNFCGINLKRQDSQWGNWTEVVIINNPYEWKQDLVRECTIGAHGGIGSCNGGETQLYRWKKYIHEKLGFDGAKRKCEEVGGQLQTRFNGLRDQLDSAYNKLQNQCFWIGIQTSDPTVWDIANEGVTHDNLVWGENQPEKVM